MKKWIKNNASIIINVSITLIGLIAAILLFFFSSEIGFIYGYLISIPIICISIYLSWYVNNKIISVFTNQENAKKTKKFIFIYWSILKYIPLIILFLILVIFQLLKFSTINSYHFIDGVIITSINIFTSEFFKIFKIKKFSSN